MSVNISDRVPMMQAMDIHAKQIIFLRECTSAIAATVLMQSQAARAVQAERAGPGGISQRLQTMTNDLQEISALLGQIQAELGGS